MVERFEAVDDLDGVEKLMHFFSVAVEDAFRRRFWKQIGLKTLINGI